MAAVAGMGTEALVALHRTALMLTGDADAATDLVVRVLGRAGRAGGPSVGTGSGGTADDQALRRLRTDLVRAYLRRTPRRQDLVVTGRSTDPGDVLRSLGPRARAASVLRLVHGWGIEETARAVRTRPGRVEALVPGTPLLDQAFLSLAAQHAHPDDQLLQDLRERLPTGPAPAAGVTPDGTGHGGEPVAAGARTAYPRVLGRLPRGGPGLLALIGALVLALAAVYAVIGPEQDPSADDVVSTTTAPGPAHNLAEAGLELDEDGDPAMLAMGLRRTTVVTVDYADPGADLALGAAGATAGVPALFAALWCDMPPAVDANLRRPTGTLTIGEEQVTLPCAGRDGSPPLSQVVPVPPGHEARLTLTGDLPPRGSATLGVYTVDQQTQHTPFTRNAGTPPPLPSDAAVLTEEDLAPGLWGARVLTRQMEIGPDSQVTVFAGGTGSVSVQIDGIPVTDDGDLRWLLDELAAEDPPDSIDGFQEPAAGAWRTQQPDVREGRWVVYVPGEQRTFTPHPLLLPAEGERRTVTVTAQVEGMQDRVQVAVTEAATLETDTAPLPLLQAEEVPVETPPFAHGHRLLGVWQAPQDGQLRQLDGAVLAAEATATFDQSLPITVVSPDPAAGAEPAQQALSAWWGSGVLVSGSSGTPVVEGSDSPFGTETGEPTVADRLEESLRQVAGWAFPVEGSWTEPRELAILLSPRRGHPDAIVALYDPVPYEEFDFAGAPPPRDSWPPGTEPPGSSAAPPDAEPLLRLTGADLVDGSVTKTLPGSRGSGVVLHVTTEGPGRLRMLSDGMPVDMGWDPDGWWSSWTDQPVTSEVLPSFPAGTFTDTPLTVEVEGYDEGPVIEVLPGL